MSKKRYSVAAAGFTLIETFVAISVLLTAIAGPLTLASKGISSAIIARDQMSAFYLAQDAIEFIRHRKDTSALEGGVWLEGLEACISAMCTVDSKEDDIAACGSSCPSLRQSEDDGFFSYNLLDEETNFTREVSIAPLNAHEAQLSVTVRWITVGGFSRQFTVRENIFDWQ